MKISLECAVESKIIIQKDIKISYNHKAYFFKKNPDGFLNKIQIIADIENPEKFYSEVESKPNKYIAINIKGNIDHDLYDNIISEFQELESILSFNSNNLEKIYWESPDLNLICETEEEKQKVKLQGWKFENEYLNPPSNADEQYFKTVIETKNRYSSLTIPKAFWREGINEFNSFRYINAFYNFYFILEGLYGNKKTKNRDVAAEFKKSSEFREFTKWIIDGINSSPKHKNKINEMLKYRNKSLDEESIIDLIIKTRGDLHHFANTDKKVQGTPFNQNDFESIAWVTLSLAAKAIIKKIFHINLRYSGKDIDIMSTIPDTFAPPVRGW